MGLPHISNWDMLKGVEKTTFTVSIMVRPFHTLDEPIWDLNPMSSFLKGYCKSSVPRLNHLWGSWQSYATIHQANKLPPSKVYPGSIVDFRKLWIWRVELTWTYPFYIWFGRNLTLGPHLRYSK
jgi:hypothetical protein